jgi:hypothetical protein
MTIINDMNLVTQLNKNKNLNITFLKKKEKDCTIKMNITIKNDSLHQNENKHSNLTFSNTTTDKNSEINNNNTYLNLTLSNNLQSHNFSLDSNSSIYSSQVEFTYSLCHPQQDQLDHLTIYMLGLKSNNTKENLCYSCLDNTNLLKELLDEIKIIKQDLKLFNSDKNTKQDLIIKFSDYINKINLIKIELFKLTHLIEMLKRAECSMYKVNNDKFQAALRKTNQLIEAIQDAIRKQNLNVNFIVIS